MTCSHVPSRSASLLVAVDDADTIGRLAGELYAERERHDQGEEVERLQHRVKELESEVADHEDYDEVQLAHALHEALRDMGHRDLPYEVQPTAGKVALEELAARAHAILEAWARKARAERRREYERRRGSEIAKRT